jgi:hypothetical protein
MLLHVLYIHRNWLILAPEGQFVQFQGLRTATWLDYGNVIPRRDQAGRQPRGMA